MLIMAAATFFETGLTTVGTIEEAHKTLTPLLGRASSWVFAISLLASGLSSSTVGTGPQMAARCATEMRGRKALRFSLSSERSCSACL